MTSHVALREAFFKALKREVALMTKAQSWEGHRHVWSLNRFDHVGIVSCEHFVALETDEFHRTGNRRVFGVFVKKDGKLQKLSDFHASEVDQLEFDLMTGRALMWAEDHQSPGKPSNIAAGG